VIVFFLLFVGLPLLELYLLIQVGSHIGALSTIALSIATAMLGAVLVRIQGFHVMGRVLAHLARDELPAVEMLEGALLLAAGIFLLLPGFLTDSAGFLLLVPALRRLLIARYLRLPGTPRPPQGPADDSTPRVIEGEFRRED